MVVSESLMLGTPVLTTRYAAVSEQVIEDHNAIVTGMEINNIYLGLKYLLIHPHIVDKMKENLKLDHFSNDKVLHQFFSIVCVVNLYLSPPAYW